MLTLDPPDHVIELGFEKELLVQVRQQLKSAVRPKALPCLAPLPVIDGSVKLMLFGAQSGDVPAGTGAEPQFVLKLSQVGLQEDLIWTAGCQPRKQGDINLSRRIKTAF